MANAWIVRPLRIAAASSPHTVAGLPEHVGNDYAGLIWKGSASVPFLRLDLGVEQPADTVLLFGIQLAPRPGTQWQVYGATAAEGAGYRGRGSGGAELYAGGIARLDGKGFAMMALPAAWPPIRHVDLEFGWSGGAFDIQIARAVIGRRIVLARNFGTAAAYGVRELGSLDFGPLATLLRRRAARLRTVGLTFSSVYRDEVQAAIAPLLERIGTTDTVALISDPAPDFFRERRAWLGPLVGDPGYIGVKSDRYEVQLNVIDLDPLIFGEDAA